MALLAGLRTACTIYSYSLVMSTPSTMLKSIAHPNFPK